MAAYIQVYRLSEDVAFRAKVTAASVAVARDVASESINTENHASRAALAKAVANAPDEYAPRLALGVAVQLDAATQGADVQIYGALSALWNLYAGTA